TSWRNLQSKLEGIREELEGIRTKSLYRLLPKQLTGTAKRPSNTLAKLKQEKEELEKLLVMKQQILTSTFEQVDGLLSKVDATLQDQARRIDSIQTNANGRLDSISRQLKTIEDSAAASAIGSESLKQTLKTLEAEKINIQSMHDDLAKSVSSRLTETTEALMKVFQDSVRDLTKQAEASSIESRGVRLASINATRRLEQRIEELGRVGHDNENKRITSAEILGQEITKLSQALEGIKSQIATSNESRGKAVMSLDVEVIPFGAAAPQNRQEQSSQRLLQQPDNLPVSAAQQQIDYSDDNDDDVAEEAMDITRPSSPLAERTQPSPPPPEQDDVDPLDLLAQEVSQNPSLSPESGVLTQIEMENRSSPSVQRIDVSSPTERIIGSDKMDIEDNSVLEDRAARKATTTTTTVSMRRQLNAKPKNLLDLMNEDPKENFISIELKEAIHGEDGEKKIEFTDINNFESGMGISPYLMELIVSSIVAKYNTLVTSVDQIIGFIPFYNVERTYGGHLNFLVTTDSAKRRGSWSSLKTFVSKYEGEVASLLESKRSGRSIREIVSLEKSAPANDLVLCMFNYITNTESRGKQSRITYSYQLCLYSRSSNFVFEFNPAIDTRPEEWEPAISGDDKQSLSKVATQILALANSLNREGVHLRTLDSKAINAWFTEFLQSPSSSGTDFISKLSYSGFDIKGMPIDEKNKAMITAVRAYGRSTIRDGRIAYSDIMAL